MKDNNTENLSVKFAFRVTAWIMGIFGCACVLGVMAWCIDPEYEHFSKSKIKEIEQQFQIKVSDNVKLTKYKDSSYLDTDRTIQLEVTDLEMFLSDNIIEEVYEVPKEESHFATWLLENCTFYKIEGPYGNGYFSDMYISYSEEKGKYFACIYQGPH